VNGMCTAGGKEQDPPPGGLTAELLLGAVERGTEASLRAEGGSMSPLIRSGDYVRMGPAKAHVARPGDIVAVRGSGGGSLVIHRVVARTGDRLALRGDNCAREDGWFAHEDVMGMVTRVERRGKAVWFGSGHWGRLVAWAVRHGLIWRFNRVYYGARRRARACLKFALPDSRLPEHKGDDGNE